MFMQDYAVSMTAQEVQHALDLDANRIISVTAKTKIDDTEENHEKQNTLVQQLKSKVLHHIEIDRSSTETNDIAEELLKVLMPPLDGMIIIF